MTNLEFKLPTHEEMRAIENQAHALRAAAVLSAFVATKSFLSRSVKRLSTLGLRHA